MRFSLSDLDDDKSFAQAVGNSQKSSKGPIRTSASQRPAQLSLTGQTLSEMMQGATLYKPRGLTYDIYQQRLTEQFEGLRAETQPDFAFQEDTRLSPYDAGVGEPNLNALGAIGTGPSGAGGGLAKPGAIYLLGDSLSYGLHLVGLEGKLGDKGFPTTINYDGGRSIFGKGMQVNQSGLEAVDADRAIIAQAANIIVALGTNGETNFAARMDELLTKLNATNPNAAYFWIDIAAPAVGHINTSNQTIYSKASNSIHSYTVISQFKFIWGQDKDPQTYKPSMPDPQGYLASDGIHYSNYGAYADFITQSLSTGAGSAQVGDLSWQSADNLLGHARAARDFIYGTWPEIKTIGGYRQDSFFAHPSGRALDVMSPTGASGTGVQLLHTIATWFGTNPQVFNTESMIWRQRNWGPSGWRDMEDRGSPTQNHMDHIHLQFGANNPGAPGPANTPWPEVEKVSAR